MPSAPDESRTGLLARLRRRGVFRVGASYAVIAWLLLQIGDVVLDPFDFGDAAMRVLRLRCVKCHNPEKRKGKLVMTTREAI